MTAQIAAYGRLVADPQLKTDQQGYTNDDGEYGGPPSVQPGR